MSINPENLLEDFLKETRFAVVGASNRVEKYGYKIYQHLKKKGKEVYPIHPTLADLEGDLCYPNLSSLTKALQQQSNQNVDVVNLVVPPSVTEKIVQECLGLGIDKVWMQPGAESEKAIQFCNEHGISVVYSTCIMMNL